MPITDFQKKRYKLVPGQNYEDGPISRDGTFFNMLGRKMRENNKAIADRLPGIDGKVNDEYIESVTDFINPAAGSMRFIKGLSSIKPSKSIQKTKFMDKDFAQGIEDHISDKNRNYFSDSEKRSYFENLSPHMYPYHSGDQLYRGMRVRPDDEMLQLKDGDYFMSSRAMPFSTQSDVAQAFAGPTHQEPNSIMIHLPKPKSGIDMWDLRKENAWDESEVTIPASAKFKVSGIVDDANSENPIRRMTFEEVETIPQGSRLLHYRDDKSTDYTNPETVERLRYAYQYSLDRATEKGSKKLMEMNQKRLNRLNANFAESELNRGGAAATKGKLPEFIEPRNPTFAEKFKVSESTPEDKVIDGILEQFHD